MERFAEEKARDALAFAPLPPSPWIKATDAGLEIRTRYSEPLSRLLRSIPSARWIADKRCWLVPCSASEHLRAEIPRINELAAAASQSADIETERRKQENAQQLTAMQREREERDRIAAERRPRPLKPEYLTPVAGRPLHMIWLEAIGDDTAQKLASFGWRPRQAVAQVMGSNGKGGWVRAYLHGIRDYSKANGVGSRGVQAGYQLEEGPIYWVASPTSWKSTDRYFLRVMDGKRIRMEEEEVRTCLAR